LLQNCTHASLSNAPPSEDADFHADASLSLSLDFRVHGDGVLVGVGPLASNCGVCLDSKGRVIEWAVEDDGGGGDGVDDGVGGSMAFLTK
jgi:hypothetical protein